MDVGVVRLLRYYEEQNEMVLAALAGDAKTLKKLLKQGNSEAISFLPMLHYYRGMDKSSRFFVTVTF